MPLAAVPFTYGNLTFFGDEQESKECTRRLGNSGTLRDSAQLAAGLKCIALGTGNLPDPTNTWTRLTAKDLPAKLPKALAKHASQLQATAKDHTVLMVKFVAAGPATATFVVTLKKGVVDGLFEDHQTE
ncbi:MAG: hypothetical protein QM765_34050 [Myxococcales bacterium]